MTDVDWRRVLSSLDDPALGQLAEALADVLNISVGQAYDRIETALENGNLTSHKRVS